MLETAYREAEGVLLDQAFFRLDRDAIARFTALLDDPLPTDGLRELLSSKAPSE